jgi:uncharacterized repeat protein (TIGR03837 family)
MQWDVFCRVIDNFGDIGVCWRLSADGDTGAAPGDVVIEAFGCDPPDAFVRAMAQSPRPPRWINLEYLSAEAYVERSHRLRSPQQAGPGRGLDKWFYYPGFTEASGGLIREPGLQAAQRDFDAATWLRQTLGLHPRQAGEHLVSLFCYRPPEGFGIWLAPFGPVCLLAAAGVPVPEPLPANVRLHRLPRLTQRDYDRLLWSCDLNIVRGEDSFVRAQWAARPFIWQIYPQADQAHATKLDAFADRFLQGAPGGLQGPLRELWAGWNHLAPLRPAEPAWAPWAVHTRAWGGKLRTQRDLVTQLVEFATQTG